MKYFLTISFLFCCFVFANAAKGPEYRSLRVHGMGGAFVAVADNKDALYYNPAGLNLINSLGNFENNPEMGYMQKSRPEFRLFSAGVFLPAKEINDLIDVCGAPRVGTIIKRTLFFDFEYFGNANWCSVYFDVIPDEEIYWPDSLANHPELSERLRKLDNSRIEIGTQISFLEIVLPNFGISAWANASAAPYVDLGILVPIFGYDPMQVDLVTQTAFAFSPVDKWSVGAGFKLAKRYRQLKYKLQPGLNYINIDDISVKTDDADSLEARWESFGDDVLDADLAFGMDFGILYQITRTVRLGTSLRNVFFNELGGQSITPNLSFGAMASPMILQSNSIWSRKVNFAMDYVDVLDGTVGDMFFSHLNFGAEIDQVIIPSPTKEMSFLSRLLFGAIGGVAGAGIGYLIGNGYEGYGFAIGAGIGGLIGIKFGSGGDALRVSLGGGWEGGYPAFNMGFGLFGDVVAMRFASYAEERGVKTGQSEQRFWAGELSIGF